MSSNFSAGLLLYGGKWKVRMSEVSQHLPGSLFGMFFLPLPLFLKPET